MGLDKIYYTFYRLFGGNEDMEENNFNSGFKYIPAESLFIDGNFVIYQIIAEIENDMNEILKVILSVSHNSNRSNLIDYIDKILSKNSLKKYRSYFEEIFTLDNLEDMIKMLRLKTVEFNDEKNKMKEIIASYYVEYFKNKILGLHYTKFIKGVYLIFDGIPSGFKIIEQRRRRFKNYLESNLRKRLLDKKMVNFPDNLTLNKIDGINSIFDYGKFVENMITLPKSFGPSSKIFQLIALNVRSYLLEKHSNISFWYSGVNEDGEADYKIIHLSRMCKSDNIVIHCSDFDFIILGSRLQNEKKGKLYLIRHFDNNYLIINFIKLNERVRNYLCLKYSIDDNSKLIDDFYFIINLFGNDYLPSINELSFDNNFFEIIDIMGNNLWKNNKFLLSRNKINLDMLKLIFIKLKKLENLNLKNNLKNNYFCNELIKNLDETILSFDDLRNKILKPYWFKNIMKLESWDEIYNKDIRIDLIQNYVSKIKSELLKINLEDVKNEIKGNINYDKIISESLLNEKLLKVCDNILKPYYVSSLGLKKKDKMNNIKENSYDNLYYYYYYKSKNRILKDFKNLESKNDNIILSSTLSTEREVVLNYILTLDFINYKFYNPMSLTFYFYPYYFSPKIDWLINYCVEYTDKPEKYITNEKLMDSKLHLLIISPNNKNDVIDLLDFIKNNSELILIDFEKFNVLENSILNMKFNNYRNINIKKIKKNWDEYLHNYKKRLLETSEIQQTLNNFNPKLIDL